VGNVLSFKGAATGGVLLSFDSGGHCEDCEDDQMSAGPLRSQWRGLKILEENKIPWFNRSCYGAL
jgi:hypothetical protein